MPRLTDAVLQQVLERHRAAREGLYAQPSAPGHGLRVASSLDDLPVLVQRYREALAALEAIAGDEPVPDEGWDGEDCTGCQCLIGIARLALRDGPSPGAAGKGD